MQYADGALGGTGTPPVGRRGPPSGLCRRGSLSVQFTVRVRCAKCFRQAAGSDERRSRPFHPRPFPPRRGLPKFATRL